MDAFILEKVCPVVGVILSTLQFTSGLKAVLEARRVQDLGSVNPTPLVVSLMCCLSWFIYGWYYIYALIFIHTNTGVYCQSAPKFILRIEHISGFNCQSVYIFNSSSSSGSSQSTCCFSKHGENCAS
jgi:uncharacterized protein with PQ loop repeat